MNNIERPQGIIKPSKVEWKSDIAAEMLSRLDVEYISLNPGASYRGLHDSLVNYLGNEGPQILLCLHEDHAVSIAHGYAKVKEKPMACALHSNVGLMHGLMGIFNAWCDRAPMLVVGATGPGRPEKRRPWIEWIHTAKDQGALLRDYTKWDDEPRSSEGIIEAFLRGAKMTSTAPKAPVYICLDTGLQEEAVDADLELPEIERFKSPQRVSASTTDIDTVSDLIQKAQRPLFLFGRGSRSQDDWERRIQLVEESGAYVMTSVRERSVFPSEHPQHVVSPFVWPSPKVQEIIREADLIISFDWVDLNGLLQQVEKQTTKINAKIVHVSQDSTLHRGWSMDYFGLPPADLSINADADAIVEQLTSLPNRSVCEHRWEGVEKEVAAEPSYNENGDREILAHDIEVALTKLRGSRKFTLAHTNLGWAGTAYAYRGPLDYLGYNGGGGIGAGPGLTVGVALALKDSGRQVISVLGDGDFIQGASALWTAAHYQIPALFIVANNRSNFNDEVHQETIAKQRGRPVENRWIGQRIDDPTVDIAGLARVQGVKAEGPVKTVPELIEAIERGLEVIEAGQPYLIDVNIVAGYAKFKLMSRDSV